MELLQLLRAGCRRAAVHVLHRCMGVMYRGVCKYLRFVLAHAQDLLTNPLIVPVKILRGHEVVNHEGVLAVAFHPSQPWLFTAGRRCRPSACSPTHEGVCCGRSQSVLEHAAQRSLRRVSEVPR